MLHNDLRRATEKDPKFKIRRRKNIKIKRGVKRPNMWWGIGQWQCVYPILLSGHARWPRTRTVESEIYQNLNWFASLLASSEFSTAEKQKHLRMLDTKYSINNSWRIFKRNECLINVCKSSDKRFVNCPHLHKLHDRFSRLRQCLFLKLLRQ
jgi:hypothetical protein